MDTTVDIQSRARDNMCAEMVPDKFHVNTVYVVFRSQSRRCRLFDNIAYDMTHDIAKVNRRRRRPFVFFFFSRNPFFRFDRII